MSAAEQIVRRRKQLIVHRYLYYVRSASLIDDFTYDMWERDLRLLVADNAELAARLPYDEECPTKGVGSSNLWDYPRELQILADSLLDFVARHPNGYTPEPEPPLDYISAQPGLFS